MKKLKIREESSSGVSKDTLKFKKFKKIVKKINKDEDGLQNDNLNLFKK